MKQLREYQTIAIKETFNALIESDDPIMFVMSVGGGKSICAGMICKRFQDLNKNVLCLVNNAELVRNNSLAFQDLGGNPSVFCASLNAKDYKNNIVFATPQSVMSAIKSNHPIGDRIFNLIIVDEAQGIAYKKDNSYFMRILRHFKQSYPPMRLLGLSGTPFRLDNGNTESIIGKNALFKKSVANITTEWLIANNYLVKPQFGITNVDDIDMSDYHVQKSAKNKHEALNQIVMTNKRLTYDILQEVQQIMKERNGAFIFCSTIPHCHEAAQALPPELTRIIVGSTTEKERHQILTDARNKKIKYLLSVSCLLVGVDVPFFCTAVFLRPTSSLTLFIQAIGRSLRLHPEKKNALILDYAQNLTRFSDIDHPIINEAIQPRGDHEEEERPFKCWKCSTYNSIFNRRCIGMVDGKRCDHFFEFKTCTSCDMQSDITARTCRGCGQELIDPNAKLTRTIQHTYSLNVIEATYWVSPQGNTSFPVIHAKYKCVEGDAFESYFTNSEKSKTILYNNFVKLHIDKPSTFYKRMSNLYGMRDMLNTPGLKTPTKLECTKDEHGRFKLKKKIF